MRLRLPIYGKILLWFFLDLVLILVVLLFLFRLQFHAGSSSPLAGMIGNRMEDVGSRIRDELERTDRAGWNDVLARHGQDRQVTFALFEEGGKQLAGETIDLPAEILAMLQRRSTVVENFLPPPPPPGRMDPPPPRDPRNPRDPRDPRDPGLPDVPGATADRPEPPRDPGHRPPPGPMHSIPMDFTIHTADPDGYWAGVVLPFRFDPQRPHAPAILLARSDSMGGHGLFFDLTPWVIILSVVAGLSLLVWLPLVRSLTRPLSRMTEAAGQIARGRFDIRLDERRGDEIGALAACINDMSGRLDVLVNGQKRFLGDVAHELASPIGRIQLAVGILENAGSAAERERLQDLHQEVQQLADLVNELLSFSRAEATPGRIRLEPVALADVVQRAIRREGRADVEVRTDLEPGLAALADAELLARALANVLRNAVRYAGAHGPIDIAGRASGGEVTIEVRDMGPGVPPDQVGQIFEPFFRLDQARTRECGGVGLGLAIVKTCVQACQGSVTAANRDPKGLVVTITLARADSPGEPGA